MLKSWDMRTPLHVAAQHRHPAVIQEILLDPQVRCQLAGHSPQSPDPMPSSATHQAQHPAAELCHSINDSNQRQQSSHMLGREPTTGKAQHAQRAQHSGSGSAVTTQLASQQHRLPTANDSWGHPQLSQHAQHVPAYVADPLHLSLHAQPLQAVDIIGQPSCTDHAQQQADNEQLQAAAGSLHSLQSAHMEPAMQARISTVELPSDAVDEETVHTAGDRMGDSDSNSIVDDDDADAMDALMSLTSDCSMQLPVQGNGHAGPCPI